SLFTIRFETVFLTLFFVVLVIWGMMNWSHSPALQSYLIETDPTTSEVQQSLHNSALHFGIAFGSFIVGIVIEHTYVLLNPVIGSILIIFSLCADLISLSGRSYANFYTSA